MRDIEKILAIDDEESVRKIIELQLNQLGYDVLFAKDGNDAIRVYKSNENIIKIVLLDLIMPNLGGIETLKKLKKLNSEVKTIVMSGFHSEKNMKEALKEGASCFINKPFRIKQLAGIIDKAMSG